MPALAPGEVIAHYQIRALLGAGGMGEVYLAWDTRLQREVALKIVSHEEGVEGEARAASAMNHPNAAHVYEIGAHGDLVYIAMEYVEGATLEKRLEGGALPIDDVMELVIQLADALGEAFAKGIVHRDLKPGNIVVNARGQAKILDFGIAKRTTAEALEDARTEPNAVLGTLPYMSPEQVRGAVVDPRSDQFSLGVMLYEMVAGRRPFDGDSLLDTVNNIVHAPAPPLRREDLPDALREVIFRCLEKEPSRRYASPREIVAALRRRDRVIAPVAEPRRRILSWAIPVAVVIGVAAFLWMQSREAPPAAAPTPQRLVKITSAPGLEDEPALSPDGQSIAYTSDEHGNLDIFVRPIARTAADAVEPVRITDDDADDAQPAWSPDGTRIAFVSARERGRRLSIVLSQALGNFVNAQGGDLFVVPAAGGPAAKLIENAFYPAFSPDGKWIAFQSSRGGRWDLWKIPASGGDPVQLTRDDDFDYHPSWSPDGRTIVYASGQPGPYRVKLIAPAGGTPRPITDAKDGVLLKPVFAADGKSVIYASMRGGSLNLWRLALAGGAKPERVTLGEGDDVHPTAGAGGRRIVYATVRQTPDLWSLDVASGKAEQLTFDTGREEYPHRSRGGTIVFASDRGGTDALWLRDAAGKLRQFTVRQFVGQPRWSPDGSRIAYRVTDRDVTSIALQERSGAGARIFARMAETPSWSPDGRQLTFTAWSDAQPKGQIHVADVDGGAPRRLTSLDLTASYPTFSPDGKWISFQATRDDGTRHVWIVEVATGRTRRLTDGASEDSHPQWSPVDADRILFIRNHENLMTVSVLTGEIRALTRHSEPNMVLDYPSWSPDGTRVEFSIARKRGDIYMLESSPP